MPRNVSGAYSLPAGNPVASGGTISSSWANATLADIAAELQDSLSRSGKGSLTAAFKIIDGTAGAPALTFASETQTGLYRAGAQDIRIAIGGADKLTLTATSATLSQALTGTSAAFSGALSAASATVGGSAVWTAATFDPATKLGVGAKAADSDLLDGQDSTYYTNVAARLGYTPANKAGETFTGGITGTTATFSGALSAGTGFFAGSLRANGPAASTNDSSLGVVLGYATAPVGASQSASIVVEAGGYGSNYSDLIIQPRTLGGAGAVRFYTGQDTPQERVRIAADGKVGITGGQGYAPQTALDVQIPFAQNTVDEIRIGARPPWMAGEGYPFWGLALRVGLDGDGSPYRNISVYDHGNRVDALTLAPDGKVGVGTSSPQARLDLGTGAAALAAKAALTAGGSDPNFRLIARNGSGTTVNSDQARLGMEYAPADSPSQGVAAGFRFYRGGGALDGQLGFWTQDTERMRLDNAGRLGIGTSSPTRTLDVNGQIRSTSLLLLGSGDTDNFASGQMLLYPGNGGSWFWIDNPGGKLRFSSGGSPGSGGSVVLDASGNLGIGTASPGAALHVHSEASGGITVESPGNPFIAFRRTGATYNFALGQDDAVYANTFSISRNDDPYTRYLSINGSTGNVGIGTTAPRAKLDVPEISIGTAPKRVAIYYDGAANVGKIEALHDGVSYTPLVLAPNGGNVGIGTSAPLGRLHFGADHGVEITEGASGWAQNTVLKTGYDTQDYTVLRVAGGSANTARIRVQADGKVGIGTDTPGATLDVAGDVKVSGSLTVGGVGHIIAGTVNSDGTLRYASESGVTSGINAGTYNIGSNAFKVGTWVMIPNAPTATIATGDVTSTPDYQYRAVNIINRATGSVTTSYFNFLAIRVA